MSDVNFGCCSKYKECSNTEKCINEELKEHCNYWQRNLSKGVNFYKDKPKKADGYVYLLKGKRTFRISKMSNSNQCYSLNFTEQQVLVKAFDVKAIPYVLTYEGCECEITGTQSNPAFFRVVFTIGQQQYVVKNFNGYSITEGEAIEVIALLPKELGARMIRWSSSGYANIPMKASRVESKEIAIAKNEPKKVPKVEAKVNDSNGRQYQQLSMF